MNLEQSLSQKIGLSQIKELVAWASGNETNLSRLWQLASCPDKRTSMNALWVMTHLSDVDQGWLGNLRDELIDMLLPETEVGKKRLLLELLRKQDYAAKEIRTDFLDYCMSKINSECEPYAVRCFSLYAAYKMCRHYPELLTELQEHLDMLSCQSLSPGLRSAHRQIQTKLRRLDRHRNSREREAK